MTFTRLADHERGSVLIERDDGVTYRMNTGPVTAETPHDLVHYTVEDALRMADGIWGAIAGGVVFKSMKHVSGRRPPHAAERSAELIAAYRDRLQRAEQIGGLAERFAHSGENGGALAGAVAALKQAEERWQALPIGGTLVLDWPPHRHLPRPAPRKVRRPEGAGRRKHVR